MSNCKTNVTLPVAWELLDYLDMMVCFVVNVEYIFTKSDNCLETMYFVQIQLLKLGLV